MKILKVLSKALNILLIMILVFMAIAVVASKASGGSPSLLGYQLKMVLSGSMEPGVKTGSIVAIKPGGDMTRFKKGDVITFKADEDILITHRVVEVVKNNNQVMYRTKGDNNDAADFDPCLISKCSWRVQRLYYSVCRVRDEFRSLKNGKCISFDPSRQSYSFFILFSRHGERFPNWRRRKQNQPYQSKLVWLLPLQK